jgi:hypothetical protein
MALRFGPQALDAYRARVAGESWWLRWAGVALIIGGMACVLGNLARTGQHGAPLEYAGLGLTALGWAVIAVAYWRRRSAGRQHPYGKL